MGKLLDRGLLRIGLVVGAILLSPSALSHLASGKYAAAMILFGLAAASLSFAIIPGIPVRALSYALPIFGFCAGTCLLLQSGFASSGGSWITATIILAAILFDTKGGYSACALFALLLGAVGLAQVKGALAWCQDFSDFTHSSIESLGLCTFACFAISRLGAFYRRSAAARDRLADELRQRGIELEREAAGRIDAEERAEFLQNFDHLTELPNRDSFMKSLFRALTVAEGRGRLFAVMALGIDRFKRVNEARGSSSGDAVLREAAERLRRSFREDDLVARHGGDRFVVLLSDVKSHEDLSDIIRKARMAFDRSFRIDGADIGLSASFGLALYPHDGTRPDTLVRAAEAALHQAKTDGPGSYRLYDAALHARLLDRLRVEHEMGEAVRACAFEPWFQPKVDRLGRVVGAEALARWNLSDGGFRHPADFIQAAERNGFIDDIGRIVLAKSCEKAAAWERAGLAPVSVSVNLSPYQFRSGLLVREIRAILANSRLSPSRLDLEITESGIMEEGSAAVEKLAELKALGCSISIDDFGTGYSSFATLRDFPVDTVKLPQSFVDPLPGNSRASLIASAVIELAHKLDFSVVAEGVETQDQLDWLDRARCDQYQGFLFAPPMPAPEFEATLAAGIKRTVQ